MSETFWIRGMTKKGSRHNDSGSRRWFNNWIIRSSRAIVYVHYFAASFFLISSGILAPPSRPSFSPAGGNPEWRR